MSNIILHIGEYTMSIGSDTDHNNLNGRDASDCHPISAIIGLQDELNKNARQVYEQLSPSVVWTITHNLGRDVQVETIDTSGTTMVGEISRPSINQVVVTFNGATAGKAILI
ncbi:MAG: hypothetical protein WCS15_11690 [Prevotella sp.]